jgi:phage terminase Nu1 subunit (DNA packaging protein)
MNKLLEDAIATVRELPEADQEVVARFLLSFANPDAERYQLTDAQVAEVELAKREVREGKVATEQEMSNLWRRFGL